MIFFNVKDVREFLIDMGFVLTLRKKRFRVGNDLAVYGSYFKQNKIGKVFIWEVKKIESYEELIPNVFISGLFKWRGDKEFNELKKETAKKWFELAKKLSGDELYLYMVSVR